MILYVTIDHRNHIVTVSKIKFFFQNTLEVMNRALTNSSNDENEEQLQQIEL